MRDTHGETSTYSPWEYRTTFLLFLIMGCGASWIFPNALAQQIPAFQLTLPGGLCIATYMNAATNFSFFASVTFVTTNRIFGPFPSSICVPCLLVLAAAGAFLASGTYTVVLNGVPIMLLICCAIGGAVGGLSNVIMNPFLTRFKNDFISASRCGGSVGTLLTAFIAIFQNPGSESNRRFSTSTYLLLFGLLLSTPIVSYSYIMKTGRGLRQGPMAQLAQSDPEDLQHHHPHPHQDNQDKGGAIEDVNTCRDTAAGGSASSSSSSSSSSSTFVMSPMATSSSAVVGTGAGTGAGAVVEMTTQSFSMRKAQFETISLEESHHVCADGDQTGPLDADAPVYGEIDRYAVDTWLEQRLAVLSERVVDLLCPCALIDKAPWLRRTIPYMMTIGWVNLNQWGMLSAVVPFAMASVSRHGGSMFLSLAYQFGAIGLVAGDLSTIVLRLPLVVCVTVFTACAFTIYACAAGVIDDSSPANAPIIIIVWTVSRFVEAYVSTSTYRCIATHFPPEHRESAARAVGLNDQICTTCGAIISTFLVSSYGNC